MIRDNEIYQGDTIELLKKLPENTIDLVVTSPPYNIGVGYDQYDDTKSSTEYFEWTKKWLEEIYRVLKDDGRIALNVLYEVNFRERGGRHYFSSEIWQIMKSIGFGFFGVVDLEEESPHRPKNTAWGSWMSPSAPYIYNPKECVILAYKKDYIKIEKGCPYWDHELQVTEVDGVKKTKRIYDDKSKSEFMELVFGQWKYFADTRSLTKATFSLDIPIKAIKILTYKDDLVLDPFSGSGTTCLAAKILDRRYIGFEISEKYVEISKQRIEENNTN